MTKSAPPCPTPRWRPRVLALCLLGAGTTFLAGISTRIEAARSKQPAGVSFTRAERATIYRLSSPLRLPSLPEGSPMRKAQAAVLGQRLFYDRRLSGNGKIACATCHQPDKAFTDGLPVAHGMGTGTRNTPTVINAALSAWQFWDGRADSLWSQALQPLENPLEAGTDRLHVLHVVADSPRLRQLYRNVFGSLPELDERHRFPAHARPSSDPSSTLTRAWNAMTRADRRRTNRMFSNLGKAIEAYERELVMGHSRFDRFAATLKQGRPSAHLLSTAAQRGLKLFVGAGHCVDCHSGPQLSDGQFHNLGLPVRPGSIADTGRAAGIAQLEADRFNAAGPYADPADAMARQRLGFLPSPRSQLGAFKTPSLRNVARTAPYMHDGRFASLRQVMDFYAKGRAGIHGRVVGKRDGTADLVPHLSVRQEKDLIAFLDALDSAPIPAHLKAAPHRLPTTRPSRPASG